MYSFEYLREIGIIQLYNNIFDIHRENFIREKYNLIEYKNKFLPTLFLTNKNSGIINQHFGEIYIIRNLDCNFDNCDNFIKEIEKYEFENTEKKIIMNNEEKIYFEKLQKNVFEDDYSENNGNFPYYEKFFVNFYEKILLTSIGEIKQKRKINLQRAINKNLIECRDKIIPKKVHCIWISKKESPYKIPESKKEMLFKNIRNNKQFDFILYTNVEDDIKYERLTVKKIDFEKDIYFGKSLVLRLYDENRFVAVSDIIRFNIIYLFGGFYSDFGTELDLSDILLKYDYIFGQEGYCLGTTIFAAKQYSEIMYNICFFIENLSRIEKNIRDISNSILTPPWTSIGLLTCLSDYFLNENEILLPISYNKSIFKVSHMKSWLNNDEKMRFGQPNFRENPISKETYFSDEYLSKYDFDTSTDIYSHYNILFYKKEIENLPWENINNIFKSKRNIITNISYNTYYDNNFIIKEKKSTIFHRTWIGDSINDDLLDSLKILDEYVEFYFKKSKVYFWCESNLIIDRIKKMNLKNVILMSYNILDLRCKKIYEIYLKDKRFANANDIIRMNILYNYGGIYSDQGVIFKRDISSFINSYDYIMFKYDNNFNVDHGVFYIKNKKDELINKYFERMENIGSLYDLYNKYLHTQEDELIFSGSHYLQFIIDMNFNNKKFFFIKEPYITIKRGKTWSGLNNIENSSIFFNKETEIKNCIRKKFLRYSFTNFYENVPIKILLNEKININIIFMAQFLLKYNSDEFTDKIFNASNIINPLDIYNHFNSFIEKNYKEFYNLIREKNNNLRHFENEKICEIIDYVDKIIYTK
jgi:mannosyltransferase OCH1-like enzyme